MAGPVTSAVPVGCPGGYICEFWGEVCAEGDNLGAASPRVTFRTVGLDERGFLFKIPGRGRVPAAAVPSGRPAGVPVGRGHRDDREHVASGQGWLRWLQ